jgi:ferredoxin--NADP+ reductase
MQNVDKDLAGEKATRETILSINRWTDDLFTFRTTRPAHYSFAPGQYSRLGLMENGTAIWRPYSITSAPQDDFLEYYGVLVPGGAFTSLLDKIEPGSPIWLEKQLYGFMTVDRFVDGEDLWLLATGTGIGPYISMLRDPAVWSKFRHIVLAHGVKQASDLGYRDELRELQANPPISATTATPHAELRLIQAVTRMQDLAPNQLRGRLTTLLDNGELEKQAGLTMQAATSRVMMCGNPAMIEDMRRILHKRDMRPCRRALPGQFVTENYW